MTCFIRSEVRRDFILGDRRENMDGEPIGVREVHGDKFEPALHEAGDHFDIAGEPIKPRDDQDRACDAAEVQRLSQVRADYPYARS